MTYKVLIVEDNKTLSEALLMSLTEYKDDSIQFDGKVVHTVAQCVQELNAGGYDVVLLDLNLGDGDGEGEFTFLPVYAAANSNMGTHSEVRVPIVILTGSTDQYSGLILKGAMDVLFKSIQARELRQRIWLAILNFSYRRTQELHTDIKCIAKEEIKKLSESPEDTGRTP